MPNNEPLRIAVTGPESTGKSTLAEQLAIHFIAPWVPEFAREYLVKKGGEYSYDDILTIARQQIASEDAVPPDTEIVFLDTELLVTKIWCEVKYNRCHPWILEELGRRKYDLVLLCNTDLPWQEDPLREHPDKRDFLMNLYRTQITQYYDKVVEISGIGIDRLKMAIDAVEKTKAGVRLS